MIPMDRNGCWRGACTLTKNIRAGRNPDLKDADVIVAAMPRKIGRSPRNRFKRVIPGRRSEAEASPESIRPDLWLWIPGSRPAAEPRNDWIKVLREHVLPV